MTNLTPALLAAQARERGTPILELEPCDKCREPAAIYFYEREGRTHNGCLWCRHVEGKAPLTATDNQEVLTPAMLVDDNGVPVYEGRACAECGNKIRIVGTAYGSKNKGACLECALHQQEERQHGKEIKRLNRATTQKVHKFIVQSIERSGVVEVAPRTQQEFFELRELAYRCHVMNQQEQALNTGIRWELGHKFPAMVAGELRGKATAENIHLVQYEVNRAEGNAIPEQWERKQVISIEGCRAIQKSYEAAKAWKEAKVWEKAITPAEKKERTMRERQAQAEHAERVREICGDAVRVLEFFADDYLPTFERLKAELEAKWDRVVMKMSRQIDAFIQSGHKQPYTEVREQRLTMEAFCGAHTRLWLVVQTFQQLADGIEIVKQEVLTPEQEQDLYRLKRYAVSWAVDLLDNPKVLAMGFTHPLLSVLGDWKAWGTVEDESTGKQWLCVWQNHGLNVADMLTPFDAPSETVSLDGVNATLLTNQEVSTPHVVGLAGWSDTEEQHIYEQAKKRKAREAREERQRQQQAAQDAQRAAEMENLNTRIVSEKRACMEGLEALSWFAESEWDGVMLADAYRIIEAIQQEAHQQQEAIEQCSTPDELNGWLGSNSYRRREMRNPSIVFAGLLNPF